MAVRIFASTWLCYAGMYFYRKPFSIVKADLGDAFGAVTQELIIGNMYDTSGREIGPIFMLLVGSAACPAICLAIIRITKISGV